MKGALEIGFQALANKVLYLAEDIRKERIVRAQEDVFSFTEEFPDQCRDLRKHTLDTLAFFGTREQATNFLTGATITNPASIHIEYD